MWLRAGAGVLFRHRGNDGQAGRRASGYDVIIPTQNAVEALIRKGDLLELDKSRLANLSNEAAGYLDKDFDKGNRYSLPYAFTTTLVGYNKTELDKLGIDPADWSVIFDPAVLEKIKGRVTVMDDPQELFGAALKYLGHSANDAPTRSTGRKPRR